MLMRNFSKGIGLKERVKEVNLVTVQSPVPRCLIIQPKNNIDYDRVAQKDENGFWE